MDGLCADSETLDQRCVLGEGVGHKRERLRDDGLVFDELSWERGRRQSTNIGLQGSSPFSSSLESRRMIHLYRKHGYNLTDRMDLIRISSSFIQWYMYRYIEYKAQCPNPLRQLHKCMVVHIPYSTLVGIFTAPLFLSILGWP